MGGAWHGGQMGWDGRQGSGEERAAEVMKVHQDWSTALCDVRPATRIGTQDAQMP